MGRSAQKRISYVLPLANSAGGHRLGVNGLAVDADHSILYSGGRDGVLCAWDLDLDLARDDRNHDHDHDHDHRHGHGHDTPPHPSPPTPTRFRQQVQAHTHWVNDIALVPHQHALVSASSDLSVKVWRPHAADPLPPQTIGLHSDYVKRVAVPGADMDWVASAGLDHKIRLWDLTGAGCMREMAVGDDEKTAKRSVYALAATPTLLATGGPESIVRIWDTRTARPVTKLVGHTDNVRDILVAHDGDSLLTASSDQTVKLWSMAAGRCIHTLTVHTDSVWSLCALVPDLSVFYSADRSGLVVKSDVRGCADHDDGLSVALCQEHGGVTKVVAAGDYLWTATASSSINRWNDVETAADIELPQDQKWHRPAIATLPSRYPSPPPSASSPTTATSPSTAMTGITPAIPFQSLLRISDTARLPHAFSTKDTDASTLASLRKPAQAIRNQSDDAAVVPVRSLPDFSIEGQNGLIKHHLLNDRRRVLTLDTAGEVMLWDLLQCMPIQSYGKKHMEDVLPQLNTLDSVAHWCGVDTRTGTLTCVLDENYCFDAESYTDELQLDESIEFREDHRINLGKWVLRCLFANLIDEEIRRDEVIRSDMVQQKKEEPRHARPTNIQLPDATLSGWDHAASGLASVSTIKANSHVLQPPPTPGLAIGLATPMAAPQSVGRNSQHNPYLTPTTEEGSKFAETPQTQRSSTQDAGDYFGNAPTTNRNSNENSKPIETKENLVESKEETVQSPSEPDTPAKKGKGKFSKKFNMTFAMKKFSTATPVTEQAKPAVDDKSEDSDSRSTETDEKNMEANFSSTLHRIRQVYQEQLSAGASNLETQITPSLPNDTPLLKLPASTTILIQEDRPDAGGVTDLFEGQVGSLGLQADLIEQAAPMWLADVLLRNQLPPKDIIKISFVLEPLDNTLPNISTDGHVPLFPLLESSGLLLISRYSNNRLNANRMLRARKILAYVAERIEPAPTLEEIQSGEASIMKSDEYLELWCHGQLVPPTMTLASIRAHIWRGGSDILLHYKANGRKKIKHAPYPGPQSGSPPGPIHGLHLSMNTSLHPAPPASDASDGGKASSDTGRGLL